MCLTSIKPSRTQTFATGGVLLHYCSGSQTWSHPAFSSTLNLDLEKGHDLLSSDLFHCLLSATLNNAFDGMLGGMPCRTFTRLRRGGTSNDGPSACRSREGLGRFGLEGVDEQLRQQVDGDTILLLRFLVLTEVMQAVKQFRGSKPGYVLAEHPADPASYVRAKPSGSSDVSGLGGFPGWGCTR